MTPQQQQIFDILQKNKGKYVPIWALQAAASMNGYRRPTSYGTVKVQIHHLRKRLPEDLSITSSWGLGYKLTDAR